MINDVRRFDVGRMRKQLERTGPVVARKTRQHDRDGCGVCHEARVRRLHKSGLASGLAKYLIDAGTASTPQVKALESATAAQLAAINNTYSSVGAVPVGGRGEQA